MDKPWFFIVNLIYRSVCFLFKFVLSLYYWGKKEVVPPIKIPILLKSAKQLAEEIRNGELKSEKVVQAFIERIKEVNPYLNAIVQECFEKALREAKEADVIVQSKRFTVQQLENSKPLLGVPFTVKLLINVKGFPSTAGCKLFKGRLAKEDAPIILLLKKAGGILLATTNAPELGFSFETSNMPYGTTSNPYDTTRTPGGSSGGEAALVGAGASVIGIGNDMVGSIRLPAHFTGIFSHKSSIGLVDNTGTFPVSPKETASMVYAGPMCRYSEDLILVTRILMGDNKKYVDFDTQINFKNLKIFYFTEIRDPLTVPVNKEIVEAILKAADYFVQNYGATSMEIEIPTLEKTNLICTHKIADPFPNLLEYITCGLRSKFDVLHEWANVLLAKSTFMLSTIILITMTKTPYFYDKKNVQHYRKLEEKLNEELDNILDENSVLFCPTFPVTAPYHHEMYSLMSNICYTEGFNVTGHPVTCCPAGVDRNGMPLCIQIVGRKNNDKLTLACATELSKIFGGWKPPN